MSTKICICNQKGGSKKTSTTILIALSLAVNPKNQVLIVDVDPQSGIASFLTSDGVIPSTPGTYDLIMGKQPTVLSVNRNDIVFDYIPSSYDLDKIYTTIDHFAMKRSLKLIEFPEGYTHILFDCPPTVQGITRAACFVADKIIIPADISQSSILPTLYTISALKEMEKESCVILVGKDVVKDDTGYIANLTRDYKDKLGDNLLGFIPHNTTMQKAVAGKLAITDDKIDTILKPIKKLLGEK